MNYVCVMNGKKALIRFFRFCNVLVMKMEPLSSSSSFQTHTD
jgi:hypothetical protein